ncbi:MAG: Slp family lipoprotein [Proteobacteria bacterium]|nr:Slp family lipoprotein [Pseudomonadota bacterium]
MKRLLTLLVLVFVGLPFLSGCGSVISDAVLMDVDRTITVPMVQGNADAYIGQKVLWGGVIISTKPLKEHSRIEVLAVELAFMDQPLRYTEASHGRFLIMAPGYLDPLVYTPDMQITVAGTIKGVKSEKIGEMSYPYVLITPIEMKTFRPDDENPIEYPYWYGYPPYGYDPFMDPYFGPYFMGPGPFFPPSYPLYYPPGHHHH